MLRYPEKTVLATRKRILGLHVSAPDLALSDLRIQKEYAGLCGVHQGIRWINNALFIETFCLDL